jgi:hypothetical protein
MSLAAIKLRIRVGTALQMVRHDHPPVVFSHETAEAIEKKKTAFLRMFELRSVALVQTNAIAATGNSRGSIGRKQMARGGTAKGFEVAL